ncbi:MAG TPA: NAD(P)H-dependent oxidoreductase subunit E [Armatimonadetes bacterium]|jgi:NADH-quinone oxidoreductase subunit E|nr:NAD(P)H-dependent oxidoreductase subunit E [Armatimonadota bacterium]
MAEAAETLDLSEIDAVIDSIGRGHGSLIPILQKTQEVFGYLPKSALAHIADRLDMPVSEVVGVATFYSQFSLTRRGRTLLRLCDGTACHVGGAGRSVELAQRELGIQPGETTPDYEFTLEVVYCLGACAISPVAVVNGQVVGRATPEKVKQILDEALENSKTHQEAAVTTSA